MRPASPPRSAEGEELESDRLKARFGEMLLERELLEAKIAAPEAARPSGPAEVEIISRTTSPSSGKPYKVATGCRIWRMAQATVYRHRMPAPPRRVARGLTDVLERMVRRGAPDGTRLAPLHIFRIAVDDSLTIRRHAHFVGVSSRAGCGGF